MMYELIERTLHTLPAIVAAAVGASVSAALRNRKYKKDAEEYMKTHINEDEDYGWED